MYITTQFPIYCCMFRQNSAKSRQSIHRYIKLTELKTSPVIGPRCPEGSRKLTLTLLTWKIWWAPNNASRWQMEFNSAIKVLRLPDYVAMAQNGGKGVSLTHRPLLPPGNTAGTHFCWNSLKYNIYFYFNVY